MTQVGLLARMAAWRETRRGLPVIGEIKVSSPSHGDLLRGRSVEELVHSYEGAGVLGVSVVTGAWFGGTPELLERVARATELPVLRKDFIANRSALLQSKEQGASAVLLTERLLSPGALPRLIELALAAGVTPFVELDHADQLTALTLPAAAILAINNSDIASREQHSAGIERSLALLARARSTGAGACVSASAIGSGAAARQLVAHGYDALLIGTSLLRAPNLADALADLARGLEGLVS